MTSTTFLYIRTPEFVQTFMHDASVDDAVPIDSEVGDDHTWLFLSATHPLTDSDVCNLILKSAKKSCLMDLVPTSLVFGLLYVLLPVILCIVNS